jgi:tetratricopeptide (TPR) repeat protein
MDIRNRKVQIILTGGILTCILILVRILLISPYRSGLPELPDLTDSPAFLADQLQKASGKAHRNPNAENLGNLGMVYHSSAFYNEAAICYKLAAGRDKKEWIWSYYLGYLNQEMGESESSIENFRAAIKVNPEVHHAWYYVGAGYQNRGETYKAEVAFAKIAAMQDKTGTEKTGTRNDYFPLRAYAMFQLSRIYLNSNRLDLAENTLKQILQFHRSFGAAYRVLGNVYRIKGDSLLSRYNIIRANDLADFTPPVDTLIDKLSLLSGSEFYLLKQIDVAEKSVYPEWGLAIAENSLKKLPDNKYLISKALKLYLRLDFGNQALPLLNSHLDFYKDDFNEVKEVGDLLSDKGFYSQALIYFNVATKLKPDDFEIRTSLALCLWNMDMKKDAVLQVSEIINKNPENSDALISCIPMYIMFGDRVNAVKTLDQLKKNSPGSGRVLKYSGMIAENDGRVKEALNFYRLSFKTDQSDMSVVRYLGNLLIRQKMWKEAIDHYRSALEVFPNEPDYLERLGTLLVTCPDVKLRDYKLAKEYSERAFIHTGCPAQVIISSAKSLAESYYALGDRTNAVTFINISLNLAKNQNSPAEFINVLEARAKEFGR